MFDNFGNFEILLETFLKPKLNNIYKNDKNIKKKKKNIQFSKYIYIHLIPTYRELINYQNLWWSEDELINCRINASREIMELKNRLPSASIDDAKKLLYQPNNITYNENNFSYYM
jgi:MoaA/NifB/PqqE/SkfB family radical SAM enzyme